MARGSAYAFEPHYLRSAATIERHNALYEVALLKSENAGLKELVRGTDKQKRWATTIRITKCLECEPLMEAVKAGKGTFFDSAQWWIDGRNTSSYWIAESLGLIETSRVAQTATISEGSNRKPATPTALQMVDRKGRPVKR